ncbi:MAG: hypothetical protein GF408_03215, partial [Candidatus Omnitrophica bacterium]|nr:hypothetical protein [Candidatus Omnitrophota bacterium]
MSGISDKVNIGIIGMGFGEKVHLPAFLSSEKCRILGISSSNADKSRAAAGKYGLPRSYSSWKEVVSDKEVDAVSIA